MKAQAQRVMQFKPEAVWADDASSKTEKKQGLPGIALLVAMAFVSTAAVVAGCVWTYLTGLQQLKALAAQIADKAHAGSSQRVASLLAQADQWAFWMVLAGAGGCLVLFLVTWLGGIWLRRRWVKKHTAIKKEAEYRMNRLLGQVADSKVTAEEARRAQAEVEERLANLMKAHTNLEKEVAQRRLMERTLSQQTQQLERSKDVLEMHVQARTRELQKLQRRTELILNSAGDGICGFDLQGKATFVNPSAAKFTGWTSEELLGKTEAEIFFPVKKEGSDENVGLQKDENGHFLPEQTFYRKDGTSFPVEYVRSPIIENDKPVGTVVMFKDITERRMAEDQLNRKANELARSNRELEQFAFVASHDLQEPLRKIQAFGDRLKAKCESVQLDEGRDYLERMQNAAARMQNLINGLLTFSRVISSSQPFVQVDLSAIAREVLVDLEFRIENTKAQIQTGLLPTIHADPIQMRQLLQNLIGNAIKFQPPGAIPVVKIDAQLISRDQIKEDAKLPNAPTNSPDDKFCVLTVQDNGIGFDEQYLDKVFAVFQRLLGRTEYEGTGIGLAVCRRIAERHGGYITAQSKPGEGSIFIVILPVKQAKAEVQQ